jgi:hypothetical protein
VVRNAHVAVPPVLVQPRYAMSLMRGPMTRVEIRAARGTRDSGVVGVRSPGTALTAPRP